MKTCKNQSCNKDITGSHHLKKYCCDKCRDEDYNSKPENKEKIKEASRKHYALHFKSRRVKVSG
jgi:hypothetical protein